MLSFFRFLRPAVNRSFVPFLLFARSYSAARTSMSCFKLIISLSLSLSDSEKQFESSSVSRFSAAFCGRKEKTDWSEFQRLLPAKLGEKAFLQRTFHACRCEFTSSDLPDFERSRGFSKAVGNPRGFPGDFVLGSEKMMKKLHAGARIPIARFIAFYRDKSRDRVPLSVSRIFPPAIYRSCPRKDTGAHGFAVSRA